MPLTTLAKAARAHARAAARERVLRDERDRLIAEWLASGRGVRETAREAGIDPTHVVRLRQRGAR